MSRQAENAGREKEIDKGEGVALGPTKRMIPG